MNHTQFHVLTNLDENNNKGTPYVIDIQSHLLSSLQTRMVIPLVKASNPMSLKIKGLNFIVEVHGHTFAALTHQMVPMLTRNLGSSVLDLSDRSHDIVAAIDYLLSGV